MFRAISPQRSDSNFLKPAKEFMADVKGAGSRGSFRVGSPSKCFRPGRRDEASSSRQGTRRTWLSHASIRHLQGRIEDENHQVKEMSQPLMESESVFLKELERFLSQREAEELRRREMLHRRWTQRVWVPLQRRVEEHVSLWGPVEAKRRQSLYSDYLHHCNKGFVFLETYDVREYNPFLHSFKMSRDPKAPASLQLDGRLQKRTTRSCEAGSEPKPRHRRPLNELEASQAGNLSRFPGCASRKSSAKVQTERKKSSRLDTIPYHAIAAAAPDGRCHQAGCWFSSSQRVYTRPYIKSTEKPCLL